MASLRTTQSRFAFQVSRLIAQAYTMGYEVTLGDAYRDPRVFGALGTKQGYGHPRSAHKQRLAIVTTIAVIGVTYVFRLNVLLRTIFIVLGIVLEGVVVGWLQGRVLHEGVARGIDAYQNFGTADLGMVAFETPARDGMVVNDSDFYHSLFPSNVYQFK